MQGQSIRTEIVVLCALSVVLVALLSSLTAYHLLKMQQQQQALHTLSNLAASKTRLIEGYINNKLEHLIEESQDFGTALAMQKIDAVFQQGIESTSYKTIDSNFRPYFESIWEHGHYYDIFLINTSGDIIFTLDHESDFATNLRSDPYRNTGLARAFEQAQSLLSANMSGFEYYEPSGETAAFMATPIIRNGQLQGILAFELDTDAFYKVAENLSGLGSTGDIILGADVGDSVLITAPTRHNPDAAFTLKIPRGKALAGPIQDATQGKSGHGILPDIHGVTVLAAWDYLPSLHWGLVAKIDQDEALAGLADIRDNLFMVMAVMLLLVLGVVAWRANRIIRPLTRLTKITANLAKGKHFDIDAPTDTGVEEINLLSASFNQMSQEVLGYQNELETKVKTRTAKLTRLQTAIEQTRDIVMITDRDATIEYVNPAFEEISGYSAKEAIGRRAVLIKSGEMPPAFYKKMWDTILAGHNWQADFINRTKTGELYEVKQVISPIKNDEGNITGFVSVQHDITDEKKEQQRLEHTQRLESLGVLAGGIAHDFNNLLTAILGNAGLARRRIGNASPVAENLNQIEKASERAAELCKQMLAYSGKGKFIVLPLNLSELVAEIIKLLHISISKNISLRTDLGQHLPAIEADKAQMQQVIMNLVINASEAIGKNRDGNIVIQTGVMDVDSAYLQTTHIEDPMPAGRYVFMEISDNGCGMDDETQKKLFDPFFTTKFAGRGLGMSAILGIVRGHKGAIKVYSESGKGATFKVLFPVATDLSAEPARSTLANDEPWTGLGLIMVVDDEESLRETAGLMLQDIGFQVTTACDGVEAVEIFSRLYATIDAVLLDMTMPRMNGKTAFQEMRRIDPEARVILSSGYNEQEATSHFAGKGLAGFIQKPYRLEDLRRKFQEIFSA